MKTVYYTASSLDGFIADAEHSLDWLLQFEMTDDYPEFIAGIGVVAMGSTTYEWVLDNLGLAGGAGDDAGGSGEAGSGGGTGGRDAPGGAPSAWPYDQPTWVFTTRSLPTVPNADIRFVRGDVGPVHREMAEAAGGKNAWIVGGGELAASFHDEGLLDELIITVAPVTLGAGAPLLPRRIASPPLRLVSATRRGDAFVQLRYEVRRTD